jgi:hypothetical protein
LLRTGESIELPFDVRLLFSTNLDPADLADLAFLRRIPYKVNMPAAGLEQFKAIVKQVCAAREIGVTDEQAQSIVAFLSERCDDPLSGSLARDLVSIVVDNAELEDEPPALSVDAVALAYLQFTGKPPRDREMPAPKPREAPVAVSAPAGPEAPAQVPEMYARVSEDLEPRPAAIPSAPASHQPQPESEEPPRPTLAELGDRISGSDTGEQTG